MFQDKPIHNKTDWNNVKKNQRKLTLVGPWFRSNPSFY